MGEAPLDFARASRLAVVGHESVERVIRLHCTPFATSAGSKCQNFDGERWRDGRSLADRVQRARRPRIRDEGEVMTRAEARQRLLRLNEEHAADRDGGYALMEAIPAGPRKARHRKTGLR